MSFKLNYYNYRVKNLLLNLLSFVVVVQEVDGESLFSLDPEMMVKLMNLKTGPALKVHRKVAALKKQYGTLPSSA